MPGASLLIIKDGKPLLRRGYGMADLEAGRESHAATNYRLASITKQFTAAAILLLVEQGKLSLDDSIRHWLPTLPAITDKVTLRQLLTHTGGLTDYEDLIPPGTTEQVSDADVLRMLSGTSTNLFRTRQRLPLQQHRLCVAGAGGGKGLGSAAANPSSSSGSSRRCTWTTR